MEHSIFVYNVAAGTKSDGWENLRADMRKIRRHAKRSARGIKRKTEKERGN